MPRVIAPNGVDYSFSKSAWCRHNEVLFCAYTAPSAGVVRQTCFNCNQYGEGASRQAARDALMKIEAVGAVSEVPTT